jgi:hypothetical protein
MRPSILPLFAALLAACTTALAAGEILHPRRDALDPHYATVRLDVAEVGNQPSFKAYVLPPQADRAEDYRVKGVFPKRSGGSWLLHLRGWPGGLAGPADILVVTSEDGKSITSRFPKAMTLARRRLDVALLIDDSRSMRKTDPERLRVSAAKLFASIAATRDDVATLTVIGFSRRAQLLLPPTPPREAEAIEKALGEFEALGSTDMDAAFFMACRVMKDLPESLKMAVVLSDGRDEPGIYQGAHALFQTRRWPVFTIGLSDLADHETLKQVSEATGGRYFFSPTEDDLASIFRDIALSLHRSVHVTDWPIAANDKRRIPVDDSISRLTFALAYGNKGASVSLEPPGGTPLPLPAPGNKALLDVPSPALGNWQASAGDPGSDTLFVTADSDLELIPFPILASVTGAAPLEASCVLVRGNAPVPGAEIAAELAGERVVLHDDGRHGDTAANDGIYGGVVIPDTAAGTHICTLVARGRTHGGYAFERQAKLDVDVTDPEPPPSWAHPEIAVFSIYPGASGARHVAVGGADRARLSVALPVLPEGLRASCTEPPGQIPADGRTDVRVRIGADAAVRPGTYSGKTKVGIGDKTHETTLQIVVKAPSVIVRPPQYDFGVIEPGATATGRLEVQLSPTGAVPATVTQSAPAPLAGLPRAVTLDAGRKQVWTPTLTVPTNALPGPRSTGITLDWGWGQRQIPVTWEVPTPKPEPPPMPEPDPDPEPDPKPEPDPDPGPGTVAEAPPKRPGTPGEGDGKTPRPVTVPTDPLRADMTNAVVVTPPVQPVTPRGVEAPGVTPLPAVTVGRDTTPESPGPGGTAPLRERVSKTWPLHLLLLLLLAALLFLLIYWLLKYVHVNPMLKYFIVSAAVHALLFLATMDLLIETRIVKLEEIAPALAVKVRALEESLGFEVTPDGREIEMTETETVAEVARQSVETTESAEHIPSEVEEGTPAQSTIETAGAPLEDAASLAEIEDERAKQTAGADALTEEVEIETKSEPTPEQAERESPVEAAPQEVADMESRSAAEARPTAPDAKENAVEALDTVSQPAEEAAPVSPAELERTDPELAPEAVREELVVESKTAPSEAAAEPVEQEVEVQRPEPTLTSEADLASERPAEGDAAPASMNAVLAEAQAAARELAADLREKHTITSADVATSERDAKIAVKLVSSELPLESPTTRAVDRAELTESADGDRADSGPSRPDAPDDHQGAETEVAELSPSQSAAADAVPVEAEDSGKQAVKPQSVPEVEAVVPVKSAEGADTALEAPGTRAGAVPRAEADSDQQRAAAGPVDKAAGGAQQSDIAQATQSAPDVPATPVDVRTGSGAKQESAPAPTVAEGPVGSLAKPTEAQAPPSDSGPTRLEVHPSELAAARQAERRGQRPARQPETASGAETEVAVLGAPRTADRGDIVPLETAPGTVKRAASPQGVPAVEAVVPVKTEGASGAAANEEPGTHVGSVPKARAGGEQRRASAGPVGTSGDGARQADIAGAVRPASGSLATPVDISAGLAAKQERAPAPTVAEGPVGRLTKPARESGSSPRTGPSRLDVQPAGLAAERQTGQRSGHTVRQPAAAAGTAATAQLTPAETAASHTPRAETRALSGETGKQTPGAHAAADAADAIQAPRAKRAETTTGTADGQATPENDIGAASSVPRSTPGDGRARLSAGAVATGGSSARPAAPQSLPRPGTRTASAQKPMTSAGGIRSKRSTAPAPSVTESGGSPAPKVAARHGNPARPGPARLAVQRSGVAAERREGAATGRAAPLPADGTATARLSAAPPTAGTEPAPQTGARDLRGTVAKRSPGQQPSMGDTSPIRPPRGKRLVQQSGAGSDTDTETSVSAPAARGNRLSGIASSGDSARLQSGVPTLGPREGATVAQRPSVSPAHGGTAVRTPTMETGKRAPGTDGLAQALAMNIPTGSAKFDRGAGMASAEEALSMHVPAAGLTADITRSTTPGGLASKLPATPRAAPLNRPQTSVVPGVRMREMKSHLSFTIGDGRSGRAEATIGLARYSGDWDCSPTAMMFLGHQIRERTGMALEATDKVVSLDSPELKSLPFAYMTGHKDFRFTQRELDNLREYLENGGYLWADDSTHFNDETFDRAFRREILRVLPNARIEKLDRTFPAFKTGYDLTRGYKGYAIPPGDKYRQDYIEGITVNGRIAVVYTRNDYGDGLNIDPLTHPLKPSLTDLSPAEMQEGATRMGVNMVLHFLTHAGNAEADFLSRTAATLRRAKDASRPVVPTGPTRPFARSAAPNEWQHETWSDAGSMTGEGQQLVLRFQRGPQGKTAVSLPCSPPLELSTRDIVAFDVESRLRCGCRLALGIVSGERYFESQPFYVKPGSNTAFFDMSARTFKTENSNWEYRAGLGSFIKADRLTLLVYSPMDGEIAIENARVVTTSAGSPIPRMPPVPEGPSEFELRAP